MQMQLSVLLGGVLLIDERKRRSDVDVDDCQPIILERVLSALANWISRRSVSPLRADNTKTLRTRNARDATLGTWVILY